MCINIRYTNIKIWTIDKLSLQRHTPSLLNSISVTRKKFLSSWTENNSHFPIRIRGLWHFTRIRKIMKCASLRWCGFVDHQGSQLLPNSGSSVVFLFCHLTTLVVCNLNVFVIPRSTPSSATYLRMAPRGSSAHDGDDNSHSEFIHEAAKIIHRVPTGSLCPSWLRIALPGTSEEGTQPASLRVRRRRCWYIWNQE